MEFSIEDIIATYTEYPKKRHFGILFFRMT